MVRAAFIEQVAVTIAMVPMVLALFQEASLVSPLANAFAIPVVSWSSCRSRLRARSWTWRRSWMPRT